MNIVEEEESSKKLREFVPLFETDNKTYFTRNDDNKFEKLISLNEMFPEPETNLRRARNARKKQKRKLSKRKKLGDMAVTEFAETASKVSDRSYIDSCSRLLKNIFNQVTCILRRIIGRVVRFL